MSALLLPDDAQFFAAHPARQTRIRAAVGDEQAAEFRTLGPHDVARRRILAWRVPDDNHMVSFRGQVICLPFLAYQDEEIRNEDAEGLRLLKDIMDGAAKQHGMGPVRV